MIKALMSSKSIEWATPQDFFDLLNAKYHFTTDVCATVCNAKCRHFYSPLVDGLKQHWRGACWMNPPYGRNQTGNWVKKAFIESGKESYVVALLPARTDTKWFHDYIYKKHGVKTKFIRGRLKFGNAKHAAPFPSMLVTFDRKGNIK